MSRISSLVATGWVTAALSLTSAHVNAQTPPDASRLIDESHYGLIVTLPIQPDKREAFLNLIEPRIEFSRQRTEVVDFRVMSTPNTNTFVAIEQFKSKQAMEAFEALPESRAFLSELKPLIGGDVEITPVMPLSR